MMSPRLSSPWRAKWALPKSFGAGKSAATAVAAAARGRHTTAGSGIALLKSA